MSNRIRIARGSKANRPADLQYGEFYWEKVANGTSEGVLYMGTPDGTTSGALAVGGARAMQSWYYRGIWNTAGAFPAAPEVGDLYLMGIDGSGSLDVFKAGDFAIYAGSSQWLRINNQQNSSADIVAYTNTTSQLTATTVQSAIDELAAKRFQFGGLFDASGAAYPASPKPGQFYISQAEGTVEGTAYLKGDAAFWDGTAWNKIPFSQAFPADGILGSGTANKIAKFTDGQYVGDSNITDSGTAVTVGVDTKVTGNLQVTQQVKIGDGVDDLISVKVPFIGEGQHVGNYQVELPATAGRLMLESGTLPASQVTYDKTGTSLVAETAQAALTEMAKGKMQYAGSVGTEVALEALTPVVGGLYLITASFTIAGESGPLGMGTVLKRGDWVFYDGQAWTVIPAGYTTAIDTAFNNAGVTLGDGSTAVTQINVQTALAYLFGKKADLDENGLVPESQLPASIVGALSYKGTWDASTAYPTGAAQGNYYIVSVAGNTGGGDYEIGDWIVYNGTAWQKIDNSDKISGIKVGAGTLVGTPEIAGDATSGVSVTAAGGIITVAAGVATDTQLGVVKIGDGLAVDAGGKIAVDATDGLHINASGKLTTYLNTNGLEVDSNQMLGIKAASNLTFTAGALDLADTTVVAGTYPKVTVDAKGRVTGGATLLVSDIPVTASGESGATEIYNATNGKVAGLKVTGPVGISKTGDAITLDFTQTDAAAISAKFAVAAPTDFDWSSRSTGVAEITSLVGAINANREDLDEYVALLRTKGAAIGVAAGANLIGVDGIVDVTPTGGTSGADATLQAILEGLKAYTDAQITNFVPTQVVKADGTDSLNYLAKFTGDDQIGNSSIYDNGSAVTIEKPTQVNGDVTLAAVGGVSSKLKMAVGGTAYQTTLVATAGDSSLALSLPSASGVSSGTILADFSVIDGGDYL